MKTNFPSSPFRTAEAAREDIFQSLHCALPGIVQAWHSDTQTVDVLPAIRDRSLNGLTAELPLIRDVPVFYPGGANSAPDVSHLGRGRMSADFRGCLHGWLVCSWGRAGRGDAKET